MPDTYAIREVTEHHIPSFAVVHPETGQLVSNRSIPNGYCHRPVTYGLVAAQAEANELTQRTGFLWEVTLAPNPCPSCGRSLWADDLDFLHPSNRERSAWRAGCNTHDGGCGFELEGPSALEVLRAWNAVTPAWHYSC